MRRSNDPGRLNLPSFESQKAYSMAFIDSI